MKGVYCIRTIVEGVPDMADDFSTDNMLDMYLYENGQLLEQLEEIVLENKDEDSFDENNIIEIFADNVLQCPLAKILLADHRIILIRVAVRMMAQESLILQSSHNGGQSIEMWFRLFIECQHFLHKQGSLFPEKAHDFFFFCSQSFHNILCFLQITKLFSSKTNFSR